MPPTSWSRRGGRGIRWTDSLYRGAPWAGWPSEVKAKGTYGSEELQRTVYGLYVLSRAGKAGPRDHGLHAPEARDGRCRPSRGRCWRRPTPAAGNPRATQSLAANVGEVRGDPAADGRQLQLGDPQPGAAPARPAGRGSAEPADPRPGGPAGAGRPGDHCWTTQEESFTLLALGQFLQKPGASSRPTPGRCFVGGKKVGTFTNKTVTFPPIAGRGADPPPDGRGVQAGGGVLQRAHPGRARPTTPSSRRAQGFEIERQFLDRDGKAVDLSGVRQGDLIAIRTRVRSTSGPVQNVAIVNLLPSGLEVENPRLSIDRAAPLGDRRQLPAARTWTCGTTASSSSRTCRRDTLADLLHPGARGGPRASSGCRRCRWRRCTTRPLRGRRAGDDGGGGAQVGKPTPPAREADGFRPRPRPPPTQGFRPGLSGRRSASAGLPAARPPACLRERYPAASRATLRG